MNPTPNQFTNVASKSGTASAVATDDHPKNAASLFTDATPTAAIDAFSTEVEGGILEITGGTGYCATADDWWKNFYMIDKLDSATKIRVLTKWRKCGVPSTDTTYKIYNPYHFSTISSEFQKSSGSGLVGLDFDDSPLFIRDSSGISVEFLHFKHGLEANLAIQNSSVNYIIGTNSTYAARGAWFEFSRIERVYANNYSNNGTHVTPHGGGYSGMAFVFSGDLGFIEGNSFNYNSNVGLENNYSSGVWIIRANLARGNRDFAGFDFETTAMTSYQFAHNQRSHHW